MDVNGCQWSWRNSSEKGQSKYTTAPSHSAVSHSEIYGQKLK